MIHKLIIDPNQSVEQVTRQARSLAITGGFEIELKPELNEQELKTIISLWTPEVKKFKKRDSELLSSNAFRILDLAAHSKVISSLQRTQVINLLALTGSTVMVVDDEPVMRDVVNIILEENGVLPLVVGSAEDALLQIAQAPYPIDLFFIDFSMPRINGFELYVKICELISQPKVVFSSGLKPTPPISDLIKDGKAIFIAKPFDDQTFLTALRSLNFVQKV